MGVRAVRHLAWTVLLGTLTAAAADLRAVQFIALVPDRAADQTPRVYLACSADDWNEPGRPLERVAPGLYSATIDVPPGRLEYKFTREGRWATVEKSAAGQEIANRVLRVEPDVAERVVVHSIAAWADRPPAMDRRVEFVGPLDGTPANSPTTRPTSGPVTRPASTLHGNVRVHHDFASRQLGSTRTLLVWLPPGYDQTRDARYPVLYLHDGQNVFDAATSSSGVEWQADETATRLIAAHRLRPLILVGVYSNADRINELAPFRDPRHGGGKGDAYLDFLVDTVKPFIDRTYRTRTEPDDTAIVGSSLGGLISLYAAFRRPDVFGAAGVLSPSLFWADRAMLRYAREHPLTARPKLWIDIGTEEGRAPLARDISEHVLNCRDLVALLEQQGYRRDVDLHYEEVSGGQHHERDWATRFDRVLLFLAGGEKQQP
jgi:predicted alpha/beta superfamily hydrolase